MTRHGNLCGPKPRGAPRTAPNHCEVCGPPCSGSPVSQFATPTQGGHKAKSTFL